MYFMSEKIQYEEELVAFVKLPKERSILVGPLMCVWQNSTRDIL